jgi:hypothetical protein
MRATAVRGALGKNIITSTIESFHKINAKLDEGINHCNEDVKSHSNIILNSQKSIDDLQGHITRAQKLKDNINKLLE